MPRECGEGTLSTYNVGKMRGIIRYECVYVEVRGARIQNINGIYYASCAWAWSWNELKCSCSWSLGGLLHNQKSITIPCTSIASIHYPKIPVRDVGTRPWFRIQTRNSIRYIKEKTSDFRVPIQIWGISRYCSYSIFRYMYLNSKLVVFYIFAIRKSHSANFEWNHGRVGLYRYLV